MMTEALQGKTIDETKTLFEKFQKTITRGEVEGEDLGALSVFAAMQKFPMRAKCALLPWQAMNAALNSDRGMAR